MRADCLSSFSLPAKFSSIEKERAREKVAPTTMATRTTIIRWDVDRSPFAQIDLSRWLWCSEREKGRI